MTHPCNQCDFQATSARQLSRHKAVTHVKNPLSCILCDFVTAYQTNLLRHRREVHGILGSKGNKSCKFCGFEADDNDTLIMHQLQAHQDILKSARERFAREKKSARGNCPSNETNDSTPKLDLVNSNKLFNFSNLTKDNNLIASSIFNNSNNFNQQQPESSEHSLNEDDDDKDFWKEGFLDNPASLVNFNQFSQTNSLTNNLTSNFLANFQKNFNNAFKFNPNFNNGNQLDLNNLANFNALNNFGNLGDMNNDLNALNCFGNNFNNNSTYQGICSPESSNSATSENNGSRPESKGSNLEINLQQVDLPECELNEINNQNESENNNQVDDEEDNIVVTPSIAIAASSSANSNNNQELAPTKIRRQYACTEIDCDFRTVNPREFLYHRRDIHNQKVKIFECPYCVYACRSLQKLQRHMLLVHKLETSITPPTDNGSIVKQQNQTQQSSNSSNKKDLSTKKSSSKSSTNSKKQDNDESSLNQQNDLENDEDDQIYEKSKSSSPSTRSASKGNRKVLNEDKQQVVSTGNSNKQMVQMIKCKYCQFQTDSFSKLEKHENTFHLEKRFQCPFCEIKFENLVWLQRHLLHMHQNNEKANQIVETLELILPSKRKRMKTNQNQNSSTANDNQASAEFDLNDLEKLDKTCTKCSICNYETKWFSELQKHMRVHINEKPFNCQLCSFKTKWKGDLNRHTQKYHAKAFSELNSSEQQAANATEENDTNQPQYNGEDNSEQFDSNEDNLQSTNYNNDNSELIPADMLENYRSDGEEDELMNNNLVFDSASQMNNDNLPIDYSSILNSSSNQQQLDFDKLLNLDSQQQPPLPEPQQQKTISSNLTLRNLNENLVKVYKCSYCDFICNTASRFHVHFVQHLNTKPFMCSVCEHRSSWCWDIKKHIRMKCQKDDDHVNATAVLVHHSGKRDYRKYDKYLILINKKDIDGNSSNQQDTRGLIDPLNLCNLNDSNNLNNQLSLLSNSLSNSLNSSLNNLNSLNGLNSTNFNSNLNSLSNLVNRLNENQNDTTEFDTNKSTNDDDEKMMDYTGMDPDDYNAESIVITPDINFSVGNETLDIGTGGQSLNANSTSLLSNSLSGFNNNLALNSILNQSTNNSTATSTTSSVNGKPSKLFYCAYCDYTHRDSKSLVSHLSIHAGKKPFKCRQCGFSSNWREVLNRHVASRHSGTSSDIEQLFKYTVSKYICRIIDEKGQINPGPEITTQASIKQLSNGNLSALSPYQSNNFNGTNLNDLNGSFAPNYQDFQDFQQQNSLMMLNSILAQQLSGSTSFDKSSTVNSSKNLLNLPNLSNLNGGDQQQLVKQLSLAKEKPKIVETPEVLAKHGIQGKVSGFKGEFKCDKCPFRAEKAFHMDFHSKRHVKMPGSEFKCQFCHFWVSARKSLVKHEYLHKYKDV